MKTIGDYIDILRRRRVSAALVGCGILGTAVLAALLWPPTYRSAATILIEQQEIPQDLVRSTITSFADQRIEQISARVMTSTNLLDIVREHGLYAEDFDSEPREVIIDRMRGDITRRMISADVVDPRSGRPVEATIAFTVGFDSRSPALAARVANELTNLFLNENSETRRDMAAETTAFLTDEASRLSREIAELETELAEFKQANVNMLPELAALNAQLFSNTELDIAETQRQRGVLEERRIYLQSELAQIDPNIAIIGSDGSRILSPRERLRALQAERASTRGIYGDTHLSVLRIERSITALQAELGIQEGADLDALRDRLTVARAERDRLLETHSSLSSDVVRYDRQIEALEAEVAAAEAAVPIPGDTPTDADADNPVYVQLRAQLTATDMEIAALAEKEQELGVRLDDLENRLAQAPIIERDYTALTRDLDNARANYQQIRSNARAAETAESLEMDAKGERFTLIEPALVPQQPMSPNRLLIFMLGVMGAMGAALGVVASLEALDMSVRSPGELRLLTTLVPLGVIPRIVTTEDRRLQRRRRFQYACVGFAGIVVLAGLIHFFYAPVDDLWLRAMRRLGV